MNLRIIQDISNFVFVDDALEKSDIIFIPGGSSPELGEHAAELWKQGLAPLVMPSGDVSIKTGKFNGAKTKKDIYSLDYKSDCEFLTDVLIHNGVKKEAVIQETASGFTKENAIFSRKIADHLGLCIKKAVLCCKNYHSRRALMHYSFAFPDTTIYVHSVPYIDNDMVITKENWYQSRLGIDLVLGELQRYGNQFSDNFDRLLNLQ